MGPDGRFLKVWEVAIIGLIYFLAIALTEMIAWEMTNNYILGYQLLAGFLLIVALVGFLIWIFSKTTPGLVISPEDSSDTPEISGEYRYQNGLRKIYAGCFVTCLLLAFVGIVFLADPSLEILGITLNQENLRNYANSPLFTIGGILISVGVTTSIFYATLYLSDPQNYFNKIRQDYLKIMEKLEEISERSPKR